MDAIKNPCSFLSVFSLWLWLAALPPLRDHLNFENACSLSAQQSRSLCLKLRDCLINTKADALIQLL